MEVTDLSTPKYPNRDALREANDLYLDAMRPFVVHYLKRIPGEKVENLIKDVLTNEQSNKFRQILDETNDIESAIDFSYFPLIIRDNWVIQGNNRNYGFAEQFNQDRTAQSMLWLIRNGRNSCEHRGTKDLDAEFVRINLFLIADVLGKINRSDKQREVEDIRDKLFSDDTAERLAEAEENLRAAKAKSAEYKKSLKEAEKRSKDAELEKNKYEKNNTKLSGEVGQKEQRLKKLSQQLKRARTDRDKHKNNHTGTKQRLKKAEAAQADYKERLKTASEELKKEKKKREKSAECHTTVSDQLTAVQTEKNISEERLAAMRQLFTIATIVNPEIQAIFPPLSTDSDVRILDRRGTDKQDYLLGLLEQKQSTIIYVQSEEKIEQLLDFVGPEKEGIIGKHNEQTSGAEETEILEKLETGELIAIVSSGTISTLLESHCVEHFVFCHLAPDLETFFERCQIAFTSAKDACLHLIYNSKEDIEGLDKWLNQKYPDRETLEKLYTELRKLAKTNGDFINFENIYNELDMAEEGIETGLAIFEELYLLERNNDGVRLLSSSGKKLEASKIHCRGEELKDGVAEVHTFQLEQSPKQIWEEILKKSDVEDETTPSTVDVWPQRDLRAFDSLRQRAANSVNNADFTRFSEDDDRVNSTFSSYELEAAVFDRAEDYKTKYDLATQFVQEHGVGTLKRGVAQLIRDRDDPDYHFTEDETNMLRAFQNALRDFQAQSEQSTEMLDRDSIVDEETVEETIP